MQADAADAPTAAAELVVLQAKLEETVAQSQRQLYELRAQLAASAESASQAEERHRADMTAEQAAAAALQTESAATMQRDHEHAIAALRSTTDLQHLSTSVALKTEHRSALAAAREGYEQLVQQQASAAEQSLASATGSDAELRREYAESLQELKMENEAAHARLAASHAESAAAHELAVSKMQSEHHDVQAALRSSLDEQRAAGKALVAEQATVAAAHSEMLTVVQTSHQQAQGALRAQMEEQHTEMMLALTLRWEGQHKSVAKLGQEALVQQQVYSRGAHCRSALSHFHLLPSTVIPV
jgi:hypothetical protein